MIFGLFKTSPEREARQLARDADAIVGMARGTYRESVLSAIARLTRNGIAQMEDLAGDDPARREAELGRYKTLHREARRQHDQTGLTAYTLVIIHTRSLTLGELGAPAREIIEEFLAQWPADGEPEGTLAG
jgi:hypothetical protein